MRQLEILDSLLWAALQHAEPSALHALIREKLSRASMRVAQRIHWLAAGVIIDPDSYLEPLQALVSISDDRIRKMTTFFEPDTRLLYLVEKLDVPTLQSLSNGWETYLCLGDWKEAWSRPRCVHRSRSRY